LASKFQQTTNKTFQKIVSKKYEISIEKMQTFMLSSNMKNEQQTISHKKVTSKRRGKKQAFYAFTHTRLFSMVYYFFWWTFLQFFQKFCTRYKILHDLKPNFNFSTTFFLRSSKSF